MTTTTPTTTSKSRKVRAFVKASLALRQAKQKYDLALVEVKRREGQLTGGQLAEARRLLGVP